MSLLRSSLEFVNTTEDAEKFCNASACPKKRAFHPSIACRGNHDVLCRLRIYDLHYRVTDCRRRTQWPKSPTQTSGAP